MERARDRESVREREWKRRERDSDRVSGGKET